MKVARDQWVRSIKAWKPDPKERIYKLTLQSLAQVMTPDGILSRPRPQLLAVSGLSSERSLERHLAYAVEHGWLELIRRGVKRTACAKYLATIPGADHPPRTATDDLSTIRRARRQVRDERGRFGSGTRAAKPARPSAADVRVVDARPSAAHGTLIETFAYNQKPGADSAERYVFPFGSQRGHLLGGVFDNTETRSPASTPAPPSTPAPSVAGLVFGLTPTAPHQGGTDVRQRERAEHVREPVGVRGGEPRGSREPARRHVCGGGGQGAPRGRGTPAAGVGHDTDLGADCAGVVGRPAAVPALMDATDPIPTLCRLLAEMRPGWSTEDVKAALYEPSVWRRPFPVVAAAAVLCAADPSTESPGRLRFPGPWWSRAGETPVPPGVASQPLSEEAKAAYREAGRRGMAACRAALAEAKETA